MGTGLTNKRTAEILNCFYSIERAGQRRMSDGGGPFGFDITLALLVEEIVTSYEPAAIVETGCYVGDTTTYLASAYPNLPILACDIDPAAVGFTTYRTRRASNVLVVRQDSPELVTDVSARYSSALFYLDAHWGAQWPLGRELSAICRGIAVIHDFDIGHERFSYDEYGGIRCGPELLAQVPKLGDVYYTPNPEADYPLPCLQVGRRAGVGIVPIDVDTGPLDGNPHLIRKSLGGLRSAETAAS